MHEHLYEQLVSLLGKPRAVHVDLLIQLVQDLGEKPEIQYLSEDHLCYDFEQSGICLYFDYGIFYSVNLSILTARVRAGNMKPYPGNLPFGINFDDSEEEVSTKFPGGAMAVKDYRFDVDLRPLTVTFHFNTLDYQAPGVGERKLTMVSVVYEDALHPLRLMGK
jgi:hypothetical protein